MGNERCAVGDRVSWDAADQGVVIDVIERNELLHALDAHRSAALGCGVLISSPAGEITQVREASVGLLPRAGERRSRRDSSYDESTA